VLLIGLISVAACSSEAAPSGSGVPRVPTTDVTSPVAVETAPATTDPATTDPATTEPATSEQATTTADSSIVEATVTGVAYPSQPVGVDWPTASWPKVSWPTGPLPAGVDEAAVRSIIDEAFDPDNGVGTVDALLAVSGGRLVLEQYNGWDPATAHVSWSMAKSITQAMVGILVKEGRLDPFAPAPVPEWADPADPRHDITIDDLLRMRSGLMWQEEYFGTSDVITMLFGDGRADRGHYAADKPLIDETGSVFSYSTGSSMILARIVADQVGYGEAGTQWAQANLFGPLGMTSVVHDLDGSGVMSGGSNINMTAQDFARFGMLYLRGGAWDGRQVVAQDWVDDAYRSLPDAPEYGAGWWVDHAEDGSVESFYADGFAGQFIIVVPSLDLVVVALANDQEGRSDRAARALVEAFASGT